MKKVKILIGAGGTGGHLFPAIAVAEQISKLTNGNCEFHFIGTASKIEARVVPELGYNFHPIELAGLVKKFSVATLKLPLQLMKATAYCKKLIKNEGIDAVLCAGAYLSYPPGSAAKSMGIPLFLMESNVNPGKAIKALSGKAANIFTSFDESASYFEESLRKKMIVTGNPIRGSILNPCDVIESRKKFGLDANKKTILVFGGSLGAKAINEAVSKYLSNFAKEQYQILWQTGKNYEIPTTPANIKAQVFIDDMAAAYAAADLVVSRSGATTTAELCIVGKPSILVPLPSASNNEQKHNALAMESKGAAIMCLNEKIGESLFSLADNLIKDTAKLQKIGSCATSLAKPEAAEKVAELILKKIVY